VAPLPIGRFVGSAIANRGCQFAMALTEINDLPYNLQVSLDSRYVPLCKKGRFIYEQIFKKSNFCTCRSRGSTNIDLWVDGSVYLADPRTGSPPPFRSTKQCIEFICKWQDGLLGYTKNLSHLARDFSGGSVALERTISDYQVQLILLQNSILSLRLELEHTKGELHGALGSIHVQNVEKLRIAEEVRILEDSCRILTEDLARECAVSTRMIACNHELEEQSQSREAVLSALLGTEIVARVYNLETELAQCKSNLLNMESKLYALKAGEYALGIRCRADTKGLEELIQQGGQAKKRKRLVRYILQPQSTAGIQRVNRASGGKKRLWRDKMAQKKTAIALAKFLSKGEVGILVDEPQMRVVGTEIANNVLRKLELRLD
jgi:hypothetical protein